MKTWIFITFLSIFVNWWSIPTIFIVYFYISSGSNKIQNGQGVKYSMPMSHMLARERKERRQQKGKSSNLFLLRIIMDIGILLQAT